MWGKQNHSPGGQERRAHKCSLLLRGPGTPEQQQQLITDLSPGWGNGGGGPGARGKSDLGRRVFEKHCRAEVRRGWEGPHALGDKTDRLANGGTFLHFPKVIRVGGFGQFKCKSPRAGWLGILSVFIAIPHQQKGLKAPFLVSLFTLALRLFTQWGRAPIITAS